MEICRLFHLCRSFGAGEILTAVSGMTTVPSPVLLGQVLAHRRLDAMREDYAAHLTWLVGAQLYALSGGRDYPVPDPAGLFTGAPAPGDRRSAEDIRRGVLRRLRRDGAGGTKGG